MQTTAMVESLAPVGRKMRRPKHPYTVKARPFQIVPFFIAPVLPGETMKNLLVQGKAISDAVKSVQLGWWHEQYFFYVKHRDLAAREKLTAMMLNPNEDMSTLRTATADIDWYVGANGINWVKMCYERVVEEFFRDEGKAWNECVLDDYATAYVMGKGDNLLDSLTLGSAMPDADPDDTSAIANDAQYSAWEFMRAQKLINMSYEDWLATFGVSKKEEVHKPELIRYVRDFQYPANTIDATGAVNSQMVWTTAERADKDRFFREPGFLIGVQVTRPKFYLSNFRGSVSGYLDTAFSWLPALMKDDPYTSLRNWATTAGPINGLTADPKGYWLDMRDLFLYGEQFVNFDIVADGKSNALALPAASGDIHAVTSAQVDSFFKVTTANKIVPEGVVQLAVLGAQVDHT